MSLTDTDILKQAKITDHETVLLKKLALKNYTDNEY